MSAVPINITSINTTLNANTTIDQAGHRHLKRFKRRFIKRSSKGRNTAVTIRRFDIVGNSIHIDVDFGPSQCKSAVDSLRGGLNKLLGKGTF